MGKHKHTEELRAISAELTKLKTSHQDILQTFAYHYTPHRLREQIEAFEQAIDTFYRKNLADHKATSSRRESASVLENYLDAVYKPASYTLDNTFGLFDFEAELIKFKYRFNAEVDAGQMKAGDKAKVRFRVPDVDKAEHALVFWCASKARSVKFTRQTNQTYQLLQWDDIKEKTWAPFTEDHDDNHPKLYYFHESHGHFSVHVVFATDHDDLYRCNEQTHFTEIYDARLQQWRKPNQQEQVLADRLFPPVAPTEDLSLLESEGTRSRATTFLSSLTRSTTKPRAQTKSSSASTSTSTTEDSTTPRDAHSGTASPVTTSTSLSEDEITDADDDDDDFTDHDFDGGAQPNGPIITLRINKKSPIVDAVPSMPSPPSFSLITPPEASTSVIATTTDADEHDDDNEFTSLISLTAAAVRENSEKTVEQSPPPVALTPVDQNPEHDVPPSPLNTTPTTPTGKRKGGFTGAVVSFAKRVTNLGKDDTAGNSQGNSQSKKKRQDKKDDKPKATASSSSRLSTRPSRADVSRLQQIQDPPEIHEHTDRLREIGEAARVLRGQYTTIEQSFKPFQDLQAKHRQLTNTSDAAEATRQLSDGFHQIESDIAPLKTRIETFTTTISAFYQQHPLPTQPPQSDRQSALILNRTLHDFYTSASFKADVRTTVTKSSDNFSVWDFDEKLQGFKREFTLLEEFALNFTHTPNSDTEDDIPRLTTTSFQYPLTPRVETGPTYWHPHSQNFIQFTNTDKGWNIGRWDLTESPHALYPIEEDIEQYWGSNPEASYQLAPDSSARFHFHQLDRDGEHLLVRVNDQTDAQEIYASGGSTNWRKPTTFEQSAIKAKLSPPTTPRQQGSTPTGLLLDVPTATSTAGVPSTVNADNSAAPFLFPSTGILTPTPFSPVAQPNLANDAALLPNGITPHVVISAPAEVAATDSSTAPPTSSSSVTAAPEKTVKFAPLPPAATLAKKPLPLPPSSASTSSTPAPDGTASTWAVPTKPRLENAGPKFALHPFGPLPTPPVPVESTTVLEGGKQAGFEQHISQGAKKKIAKDLIGKNPVTFWQKPRTEANVQEFTLTTADQDALTRDITATLVPHKQPDTEQTKTITKRANVNLKRAAMDMARQAKAYWEEGDIIDLETNHPLGPKLAFYAKSALMRLGVPETQINFISQTFVGPQEPTKPKNKSEARIERTLDAHTPRQTATGCCFSG